MTREDKVGSGLASLLGATFVSNGTSRSLPISTLEPAAWQPRLHLDEIKLHQLADSIRERGVLQPLLVRPHPTRPGKYEIVMGERRWRAAQVAGLSEIPCTVRPLEDNDAHVVSAIENLQREDLTRLEDVLFKLTLVARALKCPAEEAGARLKAAKSNPSEHKDDTVILTQLFRELGGETWESFTANGLPMLDMSADLLDLVRQRRLAPRVALAIQRADPKLKKDLIDLALSGASLAQVQAYVDAASGRAFATEVQSFRRVFTPTKVAKLSPEDRERALALMRDLRQLLKA